MNEPEHLARAFSFQAPTGKPVVVQLPARSIILHVVRHWEPTPPGEPEKWIVVFLAERPEDPEADVDVVEFVLHGVECGSDQAAPAARYLGVAMPEVLFGHPIGKPVLWWSNV